MKKRFLAALLAVLLLAALPGCGGGKDTAAVSPSPTVTFKPEDIAYSESMGMELDPETKQDKYHTDPVPEGKPLPVNPEDVDTYGEEELHCTLSISCAVILDHMDELDEKKHKLVPADGWILEPTEVVFFAGENVFNVLQRECRQRGIHMEFSGGNIYGSAYIEGINNLYEFDLPGESGWMYAVNDWFPNYGCERYALKDGDMVEWKYTSDCGNDIGGGYATGGGDDEEGEQT